MIRFPVPLDADLNPISDEDRRRFGVRTPKAVEAIFTSACAERQPVALRGAGNNRRAVGELSAARAGEALVLTGEEDDVDFMPLASQDQVDCIMLVDRVTVRFVAKVRSLRIVDGRLLLETEWPHEVLRRQRRENFRMSLAQGRAPTLYIFPHSPELGYPARVVDLSGGGLCAQIEEDGPTLPLGEVIHGCRLELSPLESVHFSLLVRSRERWVLPDGREGWRYGCAFDNISPQAELLVRRYVIQAERLSLRGRMRHA